MQVVQRSGASDVSKYYKGATLYNSGVAPPNWNLGLGRSNACYASDMANRLMGWVEGDSSCVESTVGSLTSSAGSTGDSSGNTGETTTPTPSSTAAYTPAATPSSTTAAAAPTITSLVNHGEGTVGDATATATKAEGVSSSCKGYYTVKSGDTCNSVETALGIASGTIEKLNTGVGNTCGDLWLGYAYCVSA